MLGLLSFFAGDRGVTGISQSGSQSKSSSRSRSIHGRVTAEIEAVRMAAAFDYAILDDPFLGGGDELQSRSC